MPYIGNTIRAADDYRLIDDISSGFNGSATSFGLRVAGSAPVPFPKSPQQVLISVNGVIQEPDPTGASGFNLVGTNIVFSSAPTNGHAFFGIIYATADYLNAGGNFPSGSLGAPSFTFIGDENTGLYRKSGGSVGFVSDATEIANFDSNGITISSGNLILGDSSGANDDRIKLGASGDLQIYHDASHSRIVDGGTGGLKIQSNALAIDNAAGTETMAAFTEDGSVQLRHDNSTKFETTTAGVTVTGNIAVTGTVDGVDVASLSSTVSGKLSNVVEDTTPQLGGNLDVNTKNIVFGDSAGTTDDRLTFGAGDDLKIYSDGTNGILEGGGSGGNAPLFLNSNTIRLQTQTGGEKYIDCQENGAVELYHNNTLRLETRANDVKFHGGLVAIDNVKLQLGSSGDLQLYHDGSHSYVDNSSGVGILRIRGVGSGSNGVQLQAKAGELSVDTIPHGKVELYFDNSKKFETTSTGFDAFGKASITGANGTSYTFVVSPTQQASPYGIRVLEPASPGNGYPLLTVTDNSGGAHFRVDSGTGGVLIAKDNKQLQIGAGQDLKLYHDGTNSYVQTDTGQIYLRSVSSNAWLRCNEGGILSTDGNEYLIRATTNDSVKLFYDNVKKFETTSGGINVVGAITVNGSAFTGGKVLQVVSKVKTNTATNSVSSQGVWEYNDSSLMVTITGASTSNKFLFIGQVTLAGARIHVALKDNSNSSVVTGMVATGHGNRRQATTGASGGSNDSHSSSTVPIIGLIDVPDTNAHSYYFQFSHTSGSTRTVRINETESTGNDVERGRYISSLQVMEIAG